MSVPSIQPADRIGAMKPYSPPARDPRITLTLDANEGAPIDASTLELLRDLTPEMLSRYPDQSALEAQIAAAHGIGANRVVITNGGDDAIDRVCRAVLNPGDVMLTHTPGFAMIPRWAQLTSAQTRSVDWLDGPFPKSSFLNAIDEGPRLVSLISPCNPTGRVIPVDDILDIADRAERVGAVLMLDQAYIDFADQDPIGAVLDRDHVVIVRTFSKALGGAGLRVGYAIAPEPVATWLRTVGGPYPVSTPSILLAAAIFERRHDRLGIIEQTKQNRQQLTDLLRSNGVRTLDSQANFVLAQFEDAKAVHESLLDRGISVRRFGSGSMLDAYLRFTVPTDPAHLALLLESLNTIGAAS